MTGNRGPAHVYIDGYNLYKGVLQGTGSKWLDLAKWADAMMPNYEVRRVVYCTAKAVATADNPTPHVRQAHYHKALRSTPTVDIRLGKYVPREVRGLRLPAPYCGCCSSPQVGDQFFRAESQCECCQSEIGLIRTLTEKKTDVNLAVELVADALTIPLEAVLVVSGDSDLQPAIDAVREKTRVKVGVANPRGSKVLVGDFARNVSAQRLALSQFPEEVWLSPTDAVRRPRGW